MEQITLLHARHEDLEAILALQYTAYQSEAKLLNDKTIPPLRQTIDEMRKEFDSGLFLKAVRADGRIIGSIRGHRQGDRIHLGKLMVLPEEQRRGLGKRLLLAMEKAIPAAWYELFTSDRSEGNLHLYESLGYQRYKTIPHTRQFNLVYLEKRATP